MNRTQLPGSEVVFRRISGVPVENEHAGCYVYEHEVMIL